MTPTAIARALGGEVVRGEVLAPGPGHSRADRSLCIRQSPNSPDGLLVHSFAGDDWRTCRDYVAGRLGMTRDRTELQRLPLRAAPGAPSDQDRIDRAAALWHQGVDPRGTIVETYLGSRRLELPNHVAIEAIRYHPACPWRDQALDTTLRVPVMLCALRCVSTDRIKAVHRTRLTTEGTKVDRRMLGPAAGCAIKLDADDSVTIGLAVGEGIETCLAARQIGFRPTWAMASAGAVATLPVLSGIQALMLLAEADPASERAIAACGARWAAAGCEVSIVASGVGSDLNDSLRGAA